MLTSESTVQGQSLVIKLLEALRTQLEHQKDWVSYCEAKNLQQKTPLHIACQRKATQVVHYLVRNGAPLHLTDSDQRTALQRLASSLPLSRPLAAAKQGSGDHGGHPLVSGVKNFYLSEHLHDVLLCPSMEHSVEPPAAFCRPSYPAHALVLSCYSPVFGNLLGEHQWSTTNPEKAVSRVVVQGSCDKSLKILLEV